MFLTRGTIGGNMGGIMGGISGADNFCTQQATASGYTPPGYTPPAGGYKALLSSSAGFGMNLLGSTTEYCDLASSLPIVNSRNFQNPIFNFINNAAVNGGGFTEWKFIPNAPRHITSTQFWYGKDTECNCGDWTTDSTTSTCVGASGSATGGRLTFDSFAPAPNTSLPDSGVIGGCSEKKHLVCYDPSP